VLTRPDKSDTSFSYPILSLGIAVPSAFVFAITDPTTPTVSAAI